MLLVNPLQVELHVARIRLRCRLLGADGQALDAALMECAEQELVLTPGARAHVALTTTAHAEGTLVIEGICWQLADRPAVRGFRAFAVPARTIVHMSTHAPIASCFSTHCWGF